MYMQPVWKGGGTLIARSVIQCEKEAEHSLPDQ